MKTTKAQFKKFKDEFNKWVNKFGLLDYRIYFHHEKIGDDGYAMIRRNPVGCVADVYMNTEVNTSSECPFDPKREGKHEAIHLLLGRLNLLSSKQNTGAANIEDERIVKVLEKIL